MKRKRCDYVFFTRTHLKCAHSDGLEVKEWRIREMYAMLELIKISSLLFLEKEIFE